MSAKGLDKIECLKRLEHIAYDEKSFSEDGLLDQLSLASALLALADINHDREYALCSIIAKHLLGEVPEPDDADMAED